MTKKKRKVNRRHFFPWFSGGYILSGEKELISLSSPSLLVNNTNDSRAQRDCCCQGLIIVTALSSLSVITIDLYGVDDA